MKLDKNGYRSEKRDSFATAVKVLIFIFGVGVVIAAVCVYAMFSGCGSGGSDSGAPVYDENGVCVNCSNGDTSVTPEDGIIYQPGDSCNGDTCVPQPQYDTVIGACKAIKAGKKPPEVCTPQVYKEIPFGFGCLKSCFLC